MKLIFLFIFALSFYVALAEYKYDIKYIDVPVSINLVIINVVYIFIDLLPVMCKHS